MKPSIKLWGPTKISLSIICLSLLLTGGCHSQKSRKPPLSLPSSSTVSVGISRPRIMDLPIRIRLPGTILPYQTADINAQVTGYLKSVRVDLGSHVKKGDILADISVPELQNHFIKVLADFQYHLILLNRYRKTIQSSPDLVSAEEVDLARNKYLVSLGEFRKLVTQLQFSVIRAPFTGVITRRYVDLGALVGPLRIRGGGSSALFRLDDLKKVRVVIDIPQRFVNQIIPGTPASVSISQDPEQPVSGEVALISHALNPDSKTMPVQAIFPNPSGRLKPGMFIRVELLIATLSHVLTIPDNALITRHGLVFVYVINEEGRVEERRIETGEDNGIRVEVKQGLTPLDTLVVTGKHQILPGDSPRQHDFTVSSEEHLEEKRS
ncbi:MAG: efflux RND transporter periplasmic adaptor subunit [Leptospirales bacterium]